MTLAAEDEDPQAVRERQEKAARASAVITVSLTFSGIIFIIAGLILAFAVSPVFALAVPVGMLDVALGQRLGRRALASGSDTPQDD